jgi:exodeoxyribonuclease VII large subunit
VTEIVAALERLEADPAVDVIVVARGGGSMEDLLPFSDETLIRAIAGMFTPVVSAVGHETDVPLIDHVADRRASTPTDAAKLIVPDMTEELERIATTIGRARHAVLRRIEVEQHRIDALRTRPALANPGEVLTAWRQEVDLLTDRATRAVTGLIAHRRHEVEALTARVTALSPQATLDRGYAVLQRAGGEVVRDASTVTAGERLTGRVAAGAVPLVVEAS